MQTKVYQMRNKLSKRIGLAASFLFKNAKTNTGPLMIGIESTNRCTLQCKMCPRTHEMKRPIGNMDFKIFTKIIDEIKHFTEFVWLQDLGEPLLHPRIFDMIYYCRKNNLPCGISTNSTVLTPDVADKLLVSGIYYILFAFDGATKETYEKIRVGGNYEKVVSNIKGFLEKKQKSGQEIFCAVQCIAMNETKKEIKEFKKMWSLPGVNAIRIRQLTYTGTGEFTNKRKGPCYWLWYNPHIKWDGNISPCCQDINSEFVLGNVKNNSVFELWNSKKMESCRQLHIKGEGDKMSICKKCNMYQPHPILVAGGSLFSAYSRNRIVPRVESLASQIRYGVK